MAATIKDLARKLNLSTSTISYALNNGPKPVSEEVRVRVFEAAREMGYRTNRLAQSLASRRTNTIGVVLPCTVRDVILAPFVHLALNGIVNAAEETHLDVALLTAYDRTDPTQYIDLAKDSRVDGVIYLVPRIATSMPSPGTPLAIVSSSACGVEPAFIADNAGGIREAVRHLISLGHRRIGHIRGSYRTTDGDEREDAYRAEMAAHGLPVDPRHVECGDFLAEPGAEAARKILDAPLRPTAILCANDESARGLYAVCRERGIRIPEDLSVIGFDDSATAEQLRPQLTSVRQPIEEMSFAAFLAVVAQARGEFASGRQFATGLVMRGSTAPPKENVS
ncbi:LacI family DNA-binding transcriptional regulator [Fimbriimonas ginsengisoli]|uniref:Periplasmic binding protein/LacI transcriptional regulator n=1 Tax=Fimbriimonas ginsengisoli Gsoil 348 TaxID=661478 RepID=A0A068NK64_FIMGI|nr:LacI family DNA-binding transcriptional regulator [Fimbriimonas ginsengisoli]AIE83891.1 periplasmic binding protein/LacI transcriptional regulator [Fimbriimonas ginsengisoli Gsoil 348]